MMSKSNSMYKNVSIIVLFLLFIQCKNDQNHSVNSNQKVDSLHVANQVNWISEELGIADAFVLKDTVSQKDDPLFAYGTNMELPKLISKIGEYKTLNDQINSDFKTMMDEATNHPKANQDEYHKVQYSYFLKDSIITIKIEDLHAYHLSEATTEFYIYHFDTKNNKLLSTTEMFSVLGLSQVPILSAFAEQCAFPPDFTEPLFDTQWFEKVKWKDLNLMKFYQNDKQQIIIIYPVSENGFESEQVLE
jgi:hypothetical protein